jgi:hypothetical protein
MATMGNVETVDAAGLILMLAGLDPDGINFHAARYASADHYRSLICAARDGEVEPDTLGNYVWEIACATPYDGGDYLTIPCLGGDPNDVWQTICYYFKEMLDFGRAEAESDLQTF